MPLTDTLTSARKLEESGVPPQQARVFSELFEQTAAAAQQDLKEFITVRLEAVSTGLRSELRAEIRQEGESIRSELRTEIRQEGESTRTELRAEFRGELSALESRLESKFEKALRQQMLWFFAMQVAVVAATVTLVRFLF